MNYDPKVGESLREAENTIADIREVATRLRQDFIKDGFSEGAAEQMTADFWKVAMGGGNS